MSRTEREPMRSPQRTPIGQRNKLTAPKRDGFIRRFVNLDEGRVDMFLQAGWKIVNEKTQMGDDNVGQATQLGSVAHKPVGGGKQAVLMEISEAWYREDQAAKEAQLKVNEQGLLKDQNGQVPNHPNLYGEGIAIQSNRPMVQAT